MYIKEIYSASVKNAGQGSPASPIELVIAKTDGSVTKIIRRMRLNGIRLQINVLNSYEAQKINDMTIYR